MSRPSARSLSRTLPARLAGCPALRGGGVDGPDYLGRIALRHQLTDRLRETGGHVGYDVRRTARRQGHATAMLRAVLPLARGIGIDPVLVTCDVDNLASRRVIEVNGGVLEDERSGKLRFWVPTHRT
jgi:predicted acetyltransferase